MPLTPCPSPCSRVSLWLRFRWQGKDEPLNNCFCFDGVSSAGSVFELGSVEAEDKKQAQPEEVIEL